MGPQSATSLPLGEDLASNAAPSPQVAHHVPGRRKLAPEHASPITLRVTLRARNKPGSEVYEAYEKDDKEECAERGQEQHLVNDLMVGHPGCTLKDALILFEKLLDRNDSPEQVQEFLALPMTCAGLKYQTGYDPVNMEML